MRILLSLMAAALLLVPLIPSAGCAQPDMNALLARAEKGDAKAQYDYGEWLLRAGRGDRALPWFKKAAEKGHIHALASKLTMEDGTAEEQAFVLARLQAMPQDAMTLKMLAYCHFRGVGVPKDMGKFAELMARAAAMGDMDAQLELGKCHYFGKGAVKDERKAAELAGMSARQGSGDAQVFLGMLLQRGKGVAQDEKAAVSWYMKAAMQGHPAGMRHLGDCYARGEGVAPDRAKAVEWYRKAADAGDEKAAKRLKEM